MPSMMLEADYKNLPPSKVALNEKNASELGLKTGELCVISDENGLQLGGAKTIIDPQMLDGHFGIEADSAKMMSVESGFQYSLEPCSTASREPLKKIVLEVLDTNEQTDQSENVMQNHEQVAKFMCDRVLHIGMRLHWRDYGYDLVVKDTLPSLKGGEYIVFGDTVELELSASSNPFNGVLLIDSSASMLERDMVVDPQLRMVLSPLYLMAETAMPELMPLLKKIDAGEHLTRLECALIGALQFMAEKMGRGLGEKVSVISYSEEARFLGIPVADGAEPFFRVTQNGLLGTQDNKDIAITGIVPAGASVGGNGTNMEVALSLAVQAIERMRAQELISEKRMHPVVLLFLTDGVFTVGRSPTAIIKDSIAPLESTVLHTVAIGEETDDPLLDRCAELGRGSFVKVRTLEDIVQFFSSKAKSFGTTRFTGRTSKGALAETRVLGECPKCGKEDFVRSVESRDGQMVQIVTCAVCGHRQEKISL